MRYFFRPLYRYYGLVVQQFVQADIFKIANTIQPVQVNMKQREAAGVFVDQSERRAGDIILARNLKPFGQTLHEDGLAASKVTAESNDQRIFD
jgi:hypothetical protein